MRGNSNKKTIAVIAGTRPNFIKIAPILRELYKSPRFKSILIHTGQHFDFEMSKLFFNDLNLPRADFYLNINNESHSVLTGRIMSETEKLFLKLKPDLVLVVGDVDSTLAVALTASKLNISVAHVEAGLRSRDNLMPEEINRIITDRLSDFLFIHSPEAAINLRDEGINRRKIFFVGNVMIDTLKRYKELSRKYNNIQKKYDLKHRQYALLTLHRPSNVDNPVIFSNLLKIFASLSRSLPIIFPIHPRTQKRINEFKLKSILSGSNVILTNSVGYLENLNLLSNSKFVLTDSGGIQEETTYLNIPCLTLRENTERPITVYTGTNCVVGTNRKKIFREFNRIMSGNAKTGNIPKLWDGKASKRIVEVLKQNLLT